MDWIQLGATINGTSAGDQLGYSVVLSGNGNVMAVSANCGTGIGYVRVFVYNNSSWVQRGADLIGDAGGFNLAAGVALSYDGSILAIADPQADGSSGNTSDNRGSVRIYEWSDSAWTQRGATIEGETGVLAGYSVALSSNGLIVALGAIYDNGNGSQSGSARIYAWNQSTSVWEQKGGNIDGEGISDLNGFSIALSSNGSVVAMGSINYNDGCGQVRIYEWSEPDWVQRGSSIIGDSSDFTIGYTVALSGNGNTVVIPAPLANTNKGRVRIYDYIESAWVQRGSNINGKVEEDRFGGRIAISNNGNIVVIGATQNTNASSTKGYVQIYSWNNNAWVQIGSDIIGTNNDDNSGTVSISADGTIVAVGALAHNNETGHVRVFKYITPAVPCLPAGTRVLTSNGYKAIEKLTKDDLIVTSDGNAVNYTVYVTKLSATNETNAPYLIPARTFGKYPVKDLTLSPNHAFQSRPGVWQIPKYAAEHSPEIRQVDIGKPVTYYHIETPNYFKDNLVVDGTVVESYAAKQVMKGEIFYTYSARYDGLIRGRRNQSQVQTRLTK